MPRPFTPEDKQLMADLYERGVPPKEIAARLNRRPTTITQWMAANLYEAAERSHRTNFIEQDAAFCAAMRAAHPELERR